MNSTSPPPGTPRHRVSDAAEHPAPSPCRDLDGLIDELGAATEGSATLDLRIHLGFRVALRSAPDIAKLLIEQQVTWPTVEAVMEETVPPYSTALDAALDGEDICFTLRSARQRRWAAMQRTSTGTEILVWAATEPLARRLAALSAWRREMEDARAKDATAPAPADTTPSDETEWQIAF